SRMRTASPAHVPAHVAKSDAPALDERTAEACATTRDMTSRERMRSGGLRGLQILRSGASGVRGGFDSHAFPPAFASAGRRAAGAAHPSAEPEGSAGPAIAWLRVAAPAWSAIAALALVLVAGPAYAQAQARPDSLRSNAGVQVVGGAAARARTSDAADSTRRRSWTRQPRFVMVRSLLLPGWGQVYNHAWIKAVAVAGGEGWLGAGVIEDQRRLNEILRDLDQARRDFDREREAALVNQYNERLDQRLARQWILGAVVAYALVDAYVDAHFRGFDLEFQHDPALPAGSGSGSGSSRGLGARGPAAAASALAGGGGVRIGLRW